MRCGTVFAIIDNPASGRSKRTPIVDKIEAMLRERGEEFQLFETECEGDGARQTRLALEAGFKKIVCIGGDGTLSEVVSEMAGSDAVLYVVPYGTGNDFARAYGLTGEPLQIFAAQLDGVPTCIDLGSVNGKPFINVSGTGFDVEVLRKTEDLKAVYPGAKAYRKAVLSVLSKYMPSEIEISVDGAAADKRRVTILEIANGRYFGGGMHVAPGAKLDDGLFDVVSIKPVPSYMIPFLLPLFILGIHVYIPIVTVSRAKEIVIRGKDMIINIDGRLERMDEVKYRILPKALRIMKPLKNQ